MFRFANLGRVWVPVDLPTNAADENGEGDTARVHLLMDLYTDDELAERDREVMLRSGAGLMEKARNAQDVAELGGVLDDMQRVRQADRIDLLDRTRDWRGVTDTDNDGNDVPVPFTRENFSALLGMSYLFLPIRRALFDASREGIRKN